MERKIFNRRKIEQESRELGFGNTDARQGRLMNKDGTYNFRRIGIAFFESFSFYHFLVTATWTRLIVVIILWYSVFNFVFVGLYYLVGADNLAGMIYNNTHEKFWEVYFFSAQTLTTVGYGRLNPTGFAASAVASFESLIGLMSFALITGLLYARFAKAPDVLMFSKNTVIAPFTWQGTEITALMFRMANRYNSNLMQMKIQITLSILDPETLDASGNGIRRFLTLNLERDTISFFPSSWTIVHPIDESSPFYGMRRADMQKTAPELMIIVNGFDESFDQNVYIRHSYAFDEFVWGAKFVKILSFDEAGNGRVDLGNLDTFEKKEIDPLLPILESR